ncbi:hypothetical protein ALQ85_05199 [Pseudomonas syringae]|nr:hypothetical protein ALQ85_05199 [Pseudomonas syringae]
MRHWSVRNNNLTIVRRSASGLEYAARRRVVTRIVTHGIPTLERAQRQASQRPLITPGSG